MSKAKPYLPRLEPGLIPVLYRERLRRKIPMTVLASGLIRAALRYEGVLDRRQATPVSESPSASQAKRRKHNGS